MTNREKIDSGTDKRYLRRDGTGRFESMVDMGSSLAADRRHKAKAAAKPGSR